MLLIEESQYLHLSEFVKNQCLTPSKYNKIQLIMFYHPNIKTYQLSLFNPPPLDSQPLSNPERARINQPHLVQNLSIKALPTYNQKSLLFQKVENRRGFEKQISKFPVSDPVKRENKMLLNVSISNFKDLPKSGKQLNHNVSANNLRTTVSPYHQTRRQKSIFLKRRAEKQSTITKKSQTQILLTDLKKKENKLSKTEEKKCKEAPAFLKQKFSQPSHNAISLDDFKILRQINSKETQDDFLALHHKTQAIFLLHRQKKSKLINNKDQWMQFKYCINNNGFNQNMISKFFGFFFAQEYVYFVQEYLNGETLMQYMQNKNQSLHEAEIGARICQILTAVNYLHSNGFVHGQLYQHNIINSLNICKIKRPQFKNQSKDPFFDIWCLGKLAYELKTNDQLIPLHLLQKIKSIDDIFRSHQIAKCIQKGFKRFESSNLNSQLISRDFLNFLITTLWTIQNKQISMESLWQLQFIKLFRQDELWSNEQGK